MVTGVKSALPTDWHTQAPEGTTNWETVIGLEVLKLYQSKIFSGLVLPLAPNPIVKLCHRSCDAGYLARGEQHAIDYAILFGRPLMPTSAKNPCLSEKIISIPTYPKFKPRINPLSVQVKLLSKIEGQEKVIRVHHAHLEEDAGKSPLRGTAPGFRI